MFAYISEKKIEELEKKANDPGTTALRAGYGAGSGNMLVCLRISARKK